MKKCLICIALLLCAFHLPVSAEGLRENEIINIGVIVNNDNSIEIIASTTKKTIGPTRAFLVFEEDDDPEQASAILVVSLFYLCKYISLIKISRSVMIRRGKQF